MSSAPATAPDAEAELLAAIEAKSLPRTLAALAAGAPLDAFSAADASDATWGLTPLELAVTRGTPEIVSALLARGADAIVNASAADASVLWWRA